jgi:hypothetical protein
MLQEQSNKHFELLQQNNSHAFGAGLFVSKQPHAPAAKSSNGTPMDDSTSLAGAAAHADANATETGTRFKQPACFGC